LFHFGRLPVIGNALYMVYSVICMYRQAQLNELDWSEKNEKQNFRNWSKPDGQK